MSSKIRNRLLILVALLAIAAGAAWAVRGNSKPIRLGLLHSLKGPMAISEKSMIDAELLAVEEINASGGIDGRQILPIVADGQSDPDIFAREATRLINQERVSTIIGCWTSASRKRVRGVVERYGNLLIYPMAFEGIELSPNIVYVGASANQQVLPTVNWAIETLGKRFYLVGSDYIWPRVVNEVARDQLAVQGATVAGEGYIPYGTASVDLVADDIVKKNPDVVLSTIAGDSNLPFYRALWQRGVRAGKTNVISLSVGAVEAAQIPADYIRDHYSAWSYFQNIDRPENQRFVNAFKRRYGSERVITDVDQSSYISVYLWRQAILEGGSDEPSLILENIAGQSVAAPEGIVSIDKSSHYAWRSLRIGKLGASGQFDIVWSSDRPIRPVAYPLSRPRPLWDDLLIGQFNQWGGRWVNPKTTPVRPQ